jgi:hypothetical protein
MVEQILNLTVEEANALIKAKPLLLYFPLKVESNNLRKLLSAGSNLTK